MKGIALFVIFFVVCCLAEERVRYDGWKVVRVSIETQEVFRALNSWDLDVWSGDSSLVYGENGIFNHLLLFRLGIDGPLMNEDIRVDEAHLVSLNKLGLPYQVLVENVQDLIDREQLELQAAPQVPAPLFITVLIICYRPTSLLLTIPMRRSRSTFRTSPTPILT